MKRHPISLGGEGVVCQVDESMFRHKPKNHRGRATKNEKWIFGIADTSYKPAGVYMEIVNDRSADTLIEVICRICQRGTIIYSDCWKAYNSVINHGFQHATVNHKYEFVDPSTAVHT